MAYNYYAFISYSRKDKAAARYLQGRLESYRYPAVLVDEEHKPANPKYLRRIFRDTSDLDVTQSNFTESIDRHIAESRYLVVLCSPRSQQSVWVDREIVRFLETHDNDLQRIFPVILEGEVPDCLPERLRLPEFFNRNIPTMIPDDASSQKEGWEHGFLQLVGCLLNVSIAKITDRFQKAKQAVLRRIIFGTLAALAVTIGLTVWALIAEHKAKVAEAKARHEAEVAKNALAFVKDAFEAADATRSGNKDMTLLEFAGDASAGLDKIDLPEVKIRVAEILLPLLGNMGDPKTALTRMLPLVPEAEKLHPAGSGDRAAFDLMLGKLYYSNAQYDAAADRYRLALTCHAAEGMPAKMAQSRYWLGWILYRRGKYAEAEREAEQALALYREAGMGNDREAGDVLNLLGSTKYSKGEYDAAIEYYRQSLTIKRKKLGDDHPNVAASLNNIGVAYRSKGDYDKAIEYYRQALAIKRKKLGDEHPDVAASLNNIGWAYVSKGDYDKTLEYYQQALAIYCKKLGDDHPSTADTETGLGFVLVMKGDAAEGMKLLDHALAARSQKLGDDHADTAETLHYRGLAYCAQASRTGSEADRQAAARDLKRALAIREKKLGPGHPKTEESRKALEELEQMAAARKSGE